MLYTIVTIYLLIINLVGIFIMWLDKHKAKKAHGALRKKRYFWWLCLAAVLVQPLVCTGSVIRQSIGILSLVFLPF